MKVGCQLYRRWRSLASRIITNQKAISSSRQSFSHYGEDIILDYVFKTQSVGIYVDIGCYHPSLFSNTKKLYDRGWSGINIDANLETIRLFNKYRAQDINLNVAIAETQGEADYFKFLPIDSAGGGSGNSLATSVREKYEQQGLPAEVVKVSTDTLLNINEKYLQSKKIDFLNIDVEGFDLAVLRSNDWQQFRPRVIAVEIWQRDIDQDNPLKNEVYSFLRAQNYQAFSNTIFTWFFFDQTNGLTFS